MPNMKVVDMTGKEVGTMALSDVIFGAEVNKAVLHAAVRTYLMNQRQGTQSTLTRSEVSGGGKKPWRQKGTGRARQGSTRSPQWTHGGIALGPKPRDYRLTLNKKTKRVALFSALSAKFAAGEIIVVDDIKLESFKTAEIVKMLKALGCEKEVTKTYKVTTVENGEAVGTDLREIPSDDACAFEGEYGYEPIWHERANVGKNLQAFDEKSVCVGARNLFAFMRE